MSKASNVSRATVKPEVKVSVIVAVYNTGSYLEGSIESLLHQTYSNLEIIVVDDGSDHETAALCDKAALTDSRIKVFHRKNKGAAAARNFGIKMAEGSYIAVVDSDDRAAPTYIEDLLAVAVNTGADVSVCSYSVEEESGAVINMGGDTCSISILSSEDAIKDHLLEDSRLYAVFWNKLFKKNLLTVNRITFPENDIYEDTRSLHKIYFYANKIAYLDKSLYIYLKRTGSVMNGKTNLRNLELLNIIPAETAEWLTTNAGKMYDDELFVYSLTGHINTVNYMVDRGDVRNESWLHSRDFIRTNIMKILLHKKISKKRKIACTAVFLGLVVYKLTRKTYKNK